LAHAQFCPTDGSAERIAANLFYAIHDYEKARALLTSLTTRYPYNMIDWFHRGQAEHSLGMTDEALQSFANTLLFTDDKKTIGEWVFTEFSAVYSSAGRFCEAMTPISTYISLDPARRDTARTHAMLDQLSREGNCASYAQGSDSFPVTNSSAIFVKAKVNGTVGTFVVDTGASFVALGDDFANRATIAGGSEALFSTANGATRGMVSTAGTIRLGKLQANDVPVVILQKVGDGIDGLLGQSFLSRFEMTLTASRLTLATKSSALP
jgi:clan AA aspartic protease (TIGR02281 family)